MQERVKLAAQGELLQSTYRRLRGATRLLVAGSALLGAAEAFQACGGNEATDSPKQTATTTVFIHESPVSNTPTATATATPTEVKPTATPTPKEPTSGNEQYPLETAQMLDRINNLPSLSEEQKAAVIAGFQRDWEKAKNASSDFKKSEPYMALYSSLWARYNATKDLAIRDEMTKIEAFVKSTWPDLHATLNEGGAFLREVK